MVSPEHLAEGRVLPPITEIRKVCAHPLAQLTQRGHFDYWQVSAVVAAAVAASGIADGIVDRMPPAGDLVTFMESQVRCYPYVIMWILIP